MTTRRYPSPAPLLCRDLKTFRACLTYFGRLYHDDPCLFDFTKVAFVDPTALVLLHHTLNKAGKAVSLHLPTNKLALEYFSDNLKISALAASTKRPNRYPLRYVTSEPGMTKELGKWREMLQTSGALGEEKARLFSANMSEVLVNSFAHGGASPNTCIVAGQTFPKSAHSVLAAVDYGRGIPASLRDSGRYPGDRTDEQWILLSLEKGVTSKSRPTNRGFGLYLLKEMVMQNGGSMLLVSGSGAVSITNGGKPRAEPLGPRYRPFAGTFLILDIKAT